MKVRVMVQEFLAILESPFLRNERMQPIVHLYCVLVIYGVAESEQ